MMNEIQENVSAARSLQNKSPYRFHGSSYLKNKSLSSIPLVPISGWLHDKFCLILKENPNVTTHCFLHTEVLIQKLNEMKVLDNATNMVSSVIDPLIEEFFFKNPQNKS